MDIAYGYCKCGCGEKTKLLKFNNAKRGHIAGEPSNFLHGHAQRAKMTTCTILGCENKNRSRGLCRLHYMRMWHNGSMFDASPKKEHIDISGKSFNRWFVIEKDKSKFKAIYYKCKCECGVERSVRGNLLVSGKTKSCGCLVADMRRKRTGSLSTNWKGGKRMCNGYILVKKNGHPMADSHGYVTEHRLLMSEFIGRNLMRYELVHHKNGIRTDNRISNLELLTYSNHMGIVKCPHCRKDFQLK